jgi:hypothetical protein
VSGGGRGHSADGPNARQQKRAAVAHEPSRWSSVHGRADLCGPGRAHDMGPLQVAGMVVPDAADSEVKTVRVAIEN